MPSEIKYIDLGLENVESIIIDIKNIECMYLPWRDNRLSGGDTNLNQSSRFDTNGNLAITVKGEISNA